MVVVPRTEPTHSEFSANRSVLMSWSSCSPFYHQWYHSLPFDSRRWTLLLYLFCLLNRLSDVIRGLWMLRQVWYRSNALWLLLWFWL
jgi:hypothetical protein